MTQELFLACTKLGGRRHYGYLAVVAEQTKARFIPGKARVNALWV